MPLLSESFARFCVGMVSVATRLFSDDQLDQLRSFPDIGKGDLLEMVSSSADLTGHAQ